MKITESKLKEIVIEETESLIEQDPRFAKLKNFAKTAADVGGKAAGAVGRGLGKAADVTTSVAGAVGQTAGAVGKVAGAVGDVAKLGTQALKTLRPSKQADVNTVIKGLNRIQAPKLLQKIDKPLEVQELLTNILGLVNVDPKVLNTVLARIRTQMAASAKAAPAAGAAQTANPLGA